MRHTWLQIFCPDKYLPGYPALMLTGIGTPHLHNGILPPDEDDNNAFEVDKRIYIWVKLRYSWYGQKSPGQMLPGQMSLWQLESVLDVPRNLHLKFHQNWVSNSWDIADVELWTNVTWANVAWTNVTMESVLDVPMSLHLKFHQNRVSNSWDIANIEFLWWWWWGVGWFAKSFSCLTQPSYVRLRLSWVVVGVLGLREICQSYVWKLPEKSLTYSLKYAEELSEIYMRYAWDVHESSTELGNYWLT